MRAYVLYLIVVCLCIYAWRNWLISLCGLVVLMAIMDHPEAPRTMFGVMGLNVWNVLFAVTALAWASGRSQKGFTWDMPGNVVVLLLVYWGIILFGVIRAALDPGQYREYPVGHLINDELITTTKWVLPAILVFDSCRSRRAVIAVLVSVLAMYMLFAVQVMVYMPPQAAISSSGVMDRARSRLARDMGYSASDLAVMLAGAFWGFVAALPMVRRRCSKVAMLIGVCMVFYAQALTGGRGGFVAWGGAGLTLCLLKWRKYLLLAPLVIIAFPIVFPGTAARMLEGFGQTDVMGRDTIDADAATSGRTVAWPYAIDKISESPWIGHGRLAMLREGVY